MSKFKMETIYPSTDEIKFRKKNYSDLSNIKMKCTICNFDLLNEIISKKMVMVHKTHLFLCCYNCYYKLCEGNEYSCVLCKSNNELSNCEKCNLNACNRCIENHKLDQVSNGVLNQCFACTPEVLWKQRAQSANVLKIFSSQLDKPNGLFINEIGPKDSVRKCLIKEAKIGYNSTIENIKNQICLDFILNTYKTNILKTLNEFSPKINNSIPTEEHLKKFVEIGEDILVKTCSTLTDFKRIFGLNSHLNPGVAAILKTLLKPADEDDNILNTSKSNGNLKKKLQNQDDNQSIKIYKTRSLRSISENNMDDTLKTTTSLSENRCPVNKDIIKNVAVVIEKLDDSVLSKIPVNKSFNNNNNNDVTNTEINKVIHPVDLINDSSSSDEEFTRKLRSHKVIKTDKKENKNLSEKSKRKRIDDKSDEEKEIDRLININNIGKDKLKKVLPVDNNNDDISDKTDVDNSVDQTTEMDKNTNSLMLPVDSTDKVDKMKLMSQCIQNLDDIDSSTDDTGQNNEKIIEYKDVFNDVRNTIDVFDIINNKSNSNESDDTSIDEVINSCLSACNRHGIDHYRLKANENKIDCTDDSESNNELECEENDGKLEVSSENHSTPIKVLRISRISSSDDNDSDLKTKEKGLKRKVIESSSNPDTDSSSKYFKKSDNKSAIFSSSSNDYPSKSVRTRKRKKRIKYVKKIESESSYEVSDDNSDASDNISVTPKKGRKNIRKLKTGNELSQLTQDALKEEEFRKKRIENRQKLYNKMYEMPVHCVESVSKLVLDFDPKTKEELVTVHPNIVKLLKPHQVEGVKFLWNSVFESLQQIKNSKGNGSILAHCMGLGKTLQVITLIHTLFSHPETGIKTVLIITPHSTIENWCNEFDKWLKDIPEEEKVSVFNFIESKTYETRRHLIKTWQEEHGVLVTSYQMYISVLNHRQIKKFPIIVKGLVDPGPDLIICDEGHLLKNQATKTSKALNKIKTLRRIVLTGTPLQNNLKEYHCMVDFIRPNLLGSIKEFTNRFINPITNGQYSDSTQQDVKIMKRRSHVLHRMLEGFVQRFDYGVLTPYLPPKHEYVIYLKMSDIQIELYRNYLDNHKQQDLFTNYNILQMVWTHPKLLPQYSKRMETKREKEILKDFIHEDSSSKCDSNSNSTDEVGENETVSVPGLDSTKVKIQEMDLNWWKPLLLKKNLDTVYPYSKFIMMFSILKECEEIGDKVILFSQSLPTLDLIQDFLENIEDFCDDNGGPYGPSWIQGQDFFRIDGSVPLKNRDDCCTKFNDATDTKLRLLLLSTKAFNLGINLIGANRVIIFDVTWNPSLNVQSIFRIFRFGQTKPCYVYRFVSQGSMEEKMYKRQISKLSMAFRVVDEHQIDRHFNARDQEILYEFEPKFESETTLNLPKDRLMAELLLKHKDIVIDMLEHDSLLQNNEAEELNESDRNAAWEDYQKEKDGLNQLNQQYLQFQANNQYLPFNMQQNLHAHTLSEDISLFNMLKSLFPQANMLQLNDMLIQVKTVHNGNINNFI